jgi:hypothetical protein
LAARLALVACLRRLVACFVGDGAGGSSVISWDLQSVSSLTCGAARESATSPLPAEFRGLHRSQEARVCFSVV